MSRLLDSNTCIVYLRRGESASVAKQLAQTAVSGICLCSIVVGELLYGALRSSKPMETAQQVREFLRRFVSLPFDDRAANEYARLRAFLARQGTPIGPNDLMIAWIALAHGLTLVTHNTAEFSRVPGLAIEDWQAG